MRLWQYGISPRVNLAWRAPLRLLAQCHSFAAVALWRQGNAHQDFRAGARSGFENESAAHIGRSLAHSEQTKVVPLLSSGRRLIRVEADPVVLDRQLHDVAPVSYTHLTLPTNRIV